MAVNVIMLKVTRTFMQTKWSISWHHHVCFVWPAEQKQNSHVSWSREKHQSQLTAPGYFHPGLG